MIYRFFVAFTFTFVVFPFAAMYSLAAVYPDAHFAIDRQTWLHGMFPIAVGWILFLLPGMLPFVGHRYYDWVAEKTGFKALFQAIASGLRRTRDGAKWLKLRSQTAIANRPQPKNVLTGLRDSLQRLAKKKSDQPVEAGALSSQEAPPAVSEAEPPQAAPPVETAVTPHPQGSNAKARAAESLEKARSALKDAPKHVANVRQTIETLRHRLTPDDLQRTIDLNQYTLETFAHVKQILLELLPTADLSEADRAFCEQVVAAVPEPPSPSAADLPPPDYAFVYPDEHRDDLKQHAGKAKVLLRDADFVRAAQGDIEGGLLIMKAIVAHERRGRAVVVDPGNDDLMVGLPVSSPA